LNVAIAMSSGHRLRVWSRKAWVQIPAGMKVDLNVGINARICKLTAAVCGFTCIVDENN
jgi:hypothetical protein